MALNPSGRYCLCDRDDLGPNWEIEPDGGHCRTCEHEVHSRDERRMIAITLEAIRRHDKT